MALQILFILREHRDRKELTNKKIMNKRPIVLLLFIFQFAAAFSQIISKEELTFLTSEWKGERFPDGRPKISDDLIARAKKIGIDDAWTVLGGLGDRTLDGGGTVSTGGPTTTR